MNKTQSTEYTIALEPDGDTRIFESLAKARDFIEENRNKIRGRIEKRVWNHSKLGDWHQEIDEQKTQMLEVEKFMAARK